ncbi:MAG: hypothetical protein ACTS6A_00640 [Candidatus Hodgkinia cicadicola]
MLNVGPIVRAAGELQLIGWWFVVWCDLPHKSCYFRFKRKSFA